MLVAAVRQSAVRYKGALQWSIAAAGLGAALAGGFVWSWHGDWSDSANPLAWNPAARSDFFSSLGFGAAFGGVIGLVMALIRTRNG
jgi:hypothetical protein